MMANLSQGHIIDNNTSQFNQEIKEIPGDQGWFTIRRSINIFHHMNRLKKKVIEKKKHTHP